MSTAFAHPVTQGIVLATGAVLLLAALAIGAMTLLGRGTPAFRRELWLRYGSWLVLLPLMFGPVLLGRVWTIGAVTLLGLLCLGEFARATGLFREYLTTAVVALGIVAVGFAALDNWYRLFVALWPLTTVVILVATIPLDRPAGYIQRNALAIFAFMLLGVGLGHLGYMANDPGYRPLVLMLLAAVALNDVAAFTFGKLLGARLFGGRKLVPNTSPNKTVAGALGALCTTTALVAYLGSLIFAGTPMAHPALLLFLGVLVSVAGQCGDLMLSSIKRDIGIKDMGAALPGHGGIMDRFNSLLLVAPAVFHLINYVVGIGEGQPTRLITG
ncbi:phosphatidate cytidylyltransferase [Pseudoroseomonas wenyumeiae]|uniref:Phosphatidate cytidylyltransferase n=1 Tax=Teichococcus wenyumeiae TaxID=2478470 RepID=A0A3A9J636_9PROT|nr:phosphatidate cytidylyltransferase [Pseudoroseomonas wenyumeiae]RKK01131.1 phosphatidate cytidylyltransferase [Pseudoroseomonas wenyumeiae]RMI20839.1 phosphatidate cytidylyltransferase [Pseudoroseomonas wenyumeiae]